jgi:hypothetical protein
LTAAYKLFCERGDSDSTLNQIASEAGSSPVNVYSYFRLSAQPVDAAQALSFKLEAGEYYGPLAMFAGLDMPASSALTQQRLGWTPSGIGLIADIGQPGYFKV